MGLRPGQGGEEGGRVVGSAAEGGAAGPRARSRAATLSESPVFLSRAHTLPPPRAEARAMAACDLGWVGGAVWDAVASRHCQGRRSRSSSSISGATATATDAAAAAADAPKAAAAAAQQQQQVSLKLCSTWSSATTSAALISSSPTPGGKIQLLYFNRSPIMGKKNSGGSS